ncbi:hypothetical protein BH09PSE1_BH09PSE1_03830 [soil metagenome]
MPSIDRRLMLGLTLGVALTTTAPAFAQSERRAGRLAGRRTGSAGAQAHAAKAGTATVSFGPDPLQAYDLYPGPDTGPILLFVHGGGWSRGERSMVSALPDYAARHGLTLASTSYRLAPAVGARQEAEDLAAAIADLMRKHPGRKVFVLGHSAGAHLAALVGFDPTFLGAQGLAPADLGGVILLDGAGYDATGPRGWVWSAGRWTGCTTRRSAPRAARNGRPCRRRCGSGRAQAIRRS